MEEIVWNGDAKEFVEKLARESTISGSKSAAKVEIDRLVPHGSEIDVASAVENCIQETMNELERLMNERTRINQLLAERERKLMDYKGKYPRGAVPLEGGLIEKYYETGMRCMKLCDVNQPNNSEALNVIQLQFLPEYNRALIGIEGFSKLWIASDIRSVPDEVRTANHIQNSRIRLSIASIHSVNLKLSIVEVKNFALLHANETIVDVKPYISYADARIED
eukprot:CAMPEP_0182451648 /NCGR_PEP_ID=MMETSP1172-20130603/43830_1 /TAXON_ID=708627 /ORGANISM="Timspurckia oligopyrenoides, Strain CCMP3278" /LENGTH=221 /DNA_ID=CAMNT_0024649433 /DNA_START=620 /DNA_END=1285 /DNA_ORIENTATION=-